VTVIGQIGLLNRAGAVGGAGVSAGLSPIGVLSAAYFGASLLYNIFNPKKIEGPRLEDLTLPDTGFDQVQAWTVGTVPQNGYIIWPSDADTLITENKHTRKEGGFFGLGATEITFYTYKATFSVAFGEGTADILKLWASDGKVIYDVTDDADDAMLQKSRQMLADGRLYLFDGSESQGEDPVMAAEHGSGNNPHYMGVVRATFSGLFLGSFGNQLPGMKALVSERNIERTSQLKAVSGLGDAFKKNRVSAGFVKWNDQWLLMGGYNTAASADVTMIFASDNGREWNLQSNTNWAFPSQTQRSHFVPLVYQGALRVFGGKQAGASYDGDAAGNGIAMIHDGQIWRVEQLIANVFPRHDYAAAVFTHPTLGEIMLLVGGRVEGSVSKPPGNSANDFYRNICYSNVTSLSNGQHWQELAADAGAEYRTGATLLTHTPSGGGSDELLLIGGQHREIGGGTDYSNAVYVADFSASPIFSRRSDELTGLGVGAWEIHGAVSKDSVLTVLAKRASDSKYYLWKSSDDGMTWTVWNNGSFAVDSFSDDGVDTTAVVSGDQSAIATNQAHVVGSPSDDDIYDISSATYSSSTDTTSIVLPGVLDLTGATIYHNPITPLDAADFDLDNRPVFAEIFGQFMVIGGAGSTDGQTGVYITRKTVKHLPVNINNNLIERIRTRVNENKDSFYQLSASDLVTDDLADETIAGMRIDEQITGRGILEPLRQYKQFDAFRSDGKIKFKTRGGSSAATINAEQLGSRRLNGQAVDRVESDILPLNEMPKRVVVHYIDEEFDWGITNQHSQIINSKSQDTKEIRVPIVVTKNEAAVMAAVAAQEMRQSARANSFPVPKTYAKYEPADLVTIEEYDGHGNVEVSTLARLVTVDRNGMMGRWDTVVERVDLYSPTVQPVDPPSNPAPVVATPSAYVSFIDGPITDREDDDFGFYVVAGANKDDWEGVEIFQDNDGNFGDDTRILRINKNGILGNAVTALGEDVTTYDFDYNRTVDVEVVVGSLESKTEREVLDGANEAILGDEIIRFVTATSLGGGQYRLSGLLRGRRGTGWATGDHEVSERFALLSTAVRVRAKDSANIGAALRYQVRTVGEPAGIEFGFTNTGIGKKPYAPGSIKMFRFGEPKTIGNRLYATGSWWIEWERRIRGLNSWAGGFPLPRGEEELVYKLEFLDSSETVQHTQIVIDNRGVSVTGRPFFVYPVDTFDYVDEFGDTQKQHGQTDADAFGSIQDRLHVKIYQLGALGWGYAAEKVVTA
jgi:hypothetical protein